MTEYRVPMTDTEEPSNSKGRPCTRKRKRLDYMAIVNQNVASQAVTLPQEQNSLSHIRRQESLDSYARLQSLISGTFDHFSVFIKAKLCLGSDSHSFVVLPEDVESLTASHKRKRLDYTAFANQHVSSQRSQVMTLSREHNPLSHIRCQESLDAYAHLQSLISSMFDHFSISIKAKLRLGSDTHTPVVLSEDIEASQHLVESHSTTNEIDMSGFDVHYDLSEGFLLPSWKETCLPGHESLLLDDSDAQDGSTGNLDCLSRDTLGDDMVDKEYESNEDDSEEILGRLQESDRLFQEDEAQNAIGDFKC